MPQKPKTAQQTEPKPKRKGPCVYIATGKWPEGTLKPKAPAEAHLARGIAIRFLRYRDAHGASISEIARITGLGHQTLYDLRNGESWPHLITVARLETHFNRRLWGSEHIPGSPQLKTPRDHSAKGEQWPDGGLDADAPKEARLARGIAAAIRRQINRKNTSADVVAARRRIDPDILQDLLDGKRWPDFVTVARLETYFNRRLWGHEHKPPRRKPRPRSG